MAPDAINVLIRLNVHFSIRQKQDTFSYHPLLIFGLLCRNCPQQSRHPEYLYPQHARHR